MISPSGENNASYLFSFNTTGNLTGLAEPGQATASIPSYIRTCSMVACIVILGLGVVGNVMVPLVILRTKDMRNSTNIFLMNLSLADLLVLLVCTPSILVEVNSKPETWVLGEQMCKAVPYIELTVAHASVLTILAISFERYYAICEPLRAGYVCTKARALLICLLAWATAATFTSPILLISEYKLLDYQDGTIEPACLTELNLWSTTYFLMTMSVFFVVPVGVLVVLYAVIARHLMKNSTTTNSLDATNQRARRQVVVMLATVVLMFFLCLLPIRVFILWYILVPRESINNLGAENFFSILYLCRILLYLNSAVNPILYNLMSSKFRRGFRRLLGLSGRAQPLLHRGTLTTTLSNSTRQQYNNNSSRRRNTPRNGSLRKEALLTSFKNSNDLNFSESNL